MADKVDIKALLEAGAHFGHKTSRWHPKMSPFIHSKRGGIHIIDLTKTAEQLEKALAFAEKQASLGHQILFVGTKRQSKDPVKTAALYANQPYVVERWLGGMLTNSTTINARIKNLKDLEAKMESGELTSRYNKLEVQRFQEQIDTMNIAYGGIKDLNGRPGAVFVADILEDKNAVAEAVKLGIPVIAIVDTNTDPSVIDYPIPANDDSISTVKLIVDMIADAVHDGRAKHSAKTTDSTKKG
jgi:small subunit ribosomal protein S2